MDGDRLVRECAKLDVKEEQEVAAEKGMALDAAEWPVYQDMNAN